MQQAGQRLEVRCSLGQELSREALQQFLESEFGVRKGLDCVHACVCVCAHVCVGVCVCVCLCVCLNAASWAAP